MNARCLLAALGALVLLSLSPLSLAHAADGPPRRVIEERPFGGPPPQKRSMGNKSWSTSCKTPSRTCKLAKSKEVGSACSCKAGNGAEIAGVVEDSE